MTERTCVQCGEMYTAKVARGLYCSRSCSNKAFFANPKRARCSVEGCDLVARARGLCSTHYNRSRYTPSERHKRVMLPCEVCGTEASRRDDDRYQHVCSSACRTILSWGEGRRKHEYDWAKAAVVRARRAGARVVEVFTREEIFERDGLVCYLCDQPCDPTADPLSATYPTVDHVTPLSKGGEHSRDNARTACYGCNSAKCDRAADISPAA